MTTTENRLDASLLTDKERALLPRLLSLAQSDHPCLKGSDGTELPLPEPIYQLLVKVIQNMRSGRSMVIVPEDEAFTTQAAANFLGMSRQFFITLLESGEIAFHRVGSHRRVSFKDLRDYAAKRDAERGDRLGKLFRKVKEAGLYNSDHKGDAR
jgi:excisionase family DNA binding protein